MRRDVRMFRSIVAGCVGVAVAAGVALPAAAEPVTTGSVAPPGRVAVPAPFEGGWQYNGSAAQSGRDTVLTTASALQAGSVVYPVPFAPVGVHIGATVEIGGGTGGDGMTFALMNAATSTPSSLGDTGGGLGITGVDAVAVGLDTYRNAPDPSANFVGISQVVVVPRREPPVWTATAQVPTSLRRGTHRLDVVVGADSVTATVDGTTTVTATVDLGDRVLLAFTGGTGGDTDEHLVRDVTVTRPAVPGAIVNGGPGSGCLTLGPNAPRTPAVLSACGGTDRQRWTLTGSGRLVVNGRCLTVPNDGQKTRVDVAPCTGGQEQVWQTTSLGLLRHPASARCLAPLNASTADGTRLVVVGCNHLTPTQHWALPT